MLKVLKGWENVGHASEVKARVELKNRVNRGKTRPFIRRRAGLPLMLAVGLSTSACMPYSQSDFAGNEPPEIEVYEPEPDYERYRDYEDYRGAVSGAWSCFYSPSYDNDWHNDIVCSNGVEEHRPYLRGWDSFVTEDEIMASAAEYENELNAASPEPNTATTSAPGPRWDVLPGQP